VNVVKEIAGTNVTPDTVLYRSTLSKCLPEWRCIL